MVRRPPRSTLTYTLFPDTTPFLSDPMYDLLVASFFFAMIGMFVPLFLIPTYAITRGMGDTLASYLVAIINGASVFGRVIPRSEEHTSEPPVTNAHLVCRLLLEKKKNQQPLTHHQLNYIQPFI